MQGSNESGLNFVRRLASAGYVLGEVILQNMDKTLQQYLKELIPAKKANPNRYFEYVIKALKDFLLKYNHSDIDSICQHLIECPIIQQADHSNLLLDEETFLNNYLFALACSENNIEKMITSQCSTVSCLSRRSPVAGPVFLRTRGELYKIFNFSKRTLKDSNFCAIPGPVKLSFELLEGNNNFLSTDQILADNIGKEFESTTSCFYWCNESIWNEIKLSVNVDRIAVDESMTSNIVATHILDNNSPIYSLIFNHKVRDCFIKTKRDFVGSEHNLSINRSAPDFLWYKKDSRLFSVVLEGYGKDAYFFVPDLNIILPIPYQAEDISTALKDGILYADKILSYLARCILPGILALGGTSQQDYVKDYINLILNTHQTTPFLDESDFEQISANKHSALGGAPLLELTKVQKDIILNMNKGIKLNDFSSTFITSPLKSTIGSFNCASYLQV